MNNREWVLQRYVGEVWNEGKLEVLDELLTSDYVNHNPGLPNPAPGPEGLKPIIAAIREAFPDLEMHIERIVVDGDLAAMQLTVTGTHLGDFFGMAPTHRRFTYAQMQIERFEGDRIAEHWRVSDELGLQQQLVA